MNKKKLLLILFLIVCVYLIAIQMVSIGKTEVLTVIYGKEFDGVHNDSIEKSDYLKVLDYSYDKATVYYVDRNSSGTVCSYRKDQDDCWKEIKWKTVWSSSGSTSNMIWPYWWDTIFVSLKKQ